MNALRLEDAGASTGKAAVSDTETASDDGNVPSSQASGNTLKKTETFLNLGQCIHALLQVRMLTIARLASSKKEASQPKVWTAVNRA